MTSDLVVLAAAVLALVGCLYKLHHLRQRAAEPGTPALRALVVVLGLLAGVFLLTPRLVAAPVDAALGLSGSTRLAANVLAMVTCLAVLGWLLYLSRPREEARARLVLHARVLAAVVIAILFLFALDHPPVTTEREFTGVYTYLFLVYLGYVEVALVCLSWRYAARVEAPLMRLGLRIVSVANVLGLMFLVTEFLYLLEHQLSIEVYGSPTVGRPMYTAAAILFVLGMTLPAWGPRVGLEALWWHVTRRRAARRLRPLWTVVTRAYPGVVLDREFLAASPYGGRLAAERLPVEVHDGWLQLRSHLTPGDVHLIDHLAVRRGLDDADVAAARLMVAIHRKDSADGSAPGAEPPVEHLGTGASKTLVADVRFICDVSKNLRSHFVRDVLDQINA